METFNPVNVRIKAKLTEVEKKDRKKNLYLYY